MNVVRFGLLFAFALTASSATAQVKYQIQKAEFDQFLLNIDGQPMFPQLTPSEGNGYGNVYGWLLENPIDGMAVATGGAAQNSPAGTSFTDSIMDGLDELIGEDFADFVDDTATNNELRTDESLCLMGVDAATGRNIVRLTTEWYSTADPNSAQWDKFDMDLQDPLDADMDGETGAGPDGMFGTADDVAEPDGILDTGDGVLDAPMPIDPPGLVVFLVDLDGDGDNTNDPPTPTTAPVYTIGDGFGLSTILFDPASGPRTVQAIYWQMINFDGEYIDLNRNGNPAVDGFPPDSDLDGDGTDDAIRTDLVVPPDEDVLGGTGWTGSYGLQFGNDGSPLTSDDLMSGEMQKIGYVVDYLSDLDNEFGKDGDVLCGDVNLDGNVDLLDVGPFVNLITTGTFQAEGDIDGNGTVDLLDVAPFVAKLTAG